MVLVEKLVQVEFRANTNSMQWRWVKYNSFEGKPSSKRGVGIYIWHRRTSVMKSKGVSIGLTDQRKNMVKIILQIYSCFEENSV